MFEWHRDLEALTALCRELAKFGFDIGMSDARPGIWVRVDRSDPRWWITVDSSGEVFECRDADSRLPAGDPARAATLIAERLKSAHADHSGA